MKNRLFIFAFFSPFILFSSFAFADPTLHCRAREIDTYYGHVDVDLIFKSSDSRNFNSVIKITSGQKTLKILAQKSYEKIEQDEGSIYFGQGDAFDISNSGNEFEIMQSAFTLSIMKQGLVLIRFDLPERSGAIDVGTTDCELN